MDLLSAPPEPLPRVAGWVAFGAFTALVVAAAAIATSDDAGTRWGAAAFAVVTAAVPLLRLSGRQGIQYACSILSAIGVAGVCGDASSNLGWFAILVPLGFSVLAQALIPALVFAGGTLMAFVTAAVVGQDRGWVPWIAGTLFTLLVCLLRRREATLVVRLREAQAGLAARAQAEERARIARELHDVIAHSLTVSLLHVSSARVALADDPADADRSLAEAERLGRSSLDEVRHAVGTLRAHGASDPTTPLPGSTDLPELVAGFRRAGADVSATVDGDLDALPATVGLAAYRIVQEALTNAVKHAPGHPVTVRIEATDRSVGVQVESGGPPGAGAGLGLTGMRERADSVGGTCEAGPGGAGWRVRASLPVRAS